MTSYIDSQKDEVHIVENTKQSYFRRFDSVLYFFGGGGGGG